MLLAQKKDKSPNGNKKKQLYSSKENSLPTGKMRPLLASVTAERRYPFQMNEEKPIPEKSSEVKQPSRNWNSEAKLVSSLFFKDFGGDKQLEMHGNKFVGMTMKESRALQEICENKRPYVDLEAPSSIQKFTPVSPALKYCRKEVADLKKVERKPVSHFNNGIHKEYEEMAKLESLLHERRVRNVPQAEQTSAVLKEFHALRKTKHGYEPAEERTSDSDADSAIEERHVSRPDAYDQHTTFPIFPKNMFYDPVAMETGIYARNMNESVPELPKVNPITEFQEGVKEVHRLRQESRYKRLLAAMHYNIFGHRKQFATERGIREADENSKRHQRYPCNFRRGQARGRRYRCSVCDEYNYHRGSSISSSPEGFMHKDVMKRKRRRSHSKSDNGFLHSAIAERSSRCDITESRTGLQHDFIKKRTLYSSKDRPKRAISESHLSRQQQLDLSSSKQYNEKNRYLQKPPLANSLKEASVKDVVKLEKELSESSKDDATPLGNPINDGSERIERPKTPPAPILTRRDLLGPKAFYLRRKMWVASESRTPSYQHMQTSKRRFFLDTASEGRLYPAKDFNKKPRLSGVSYVAYVRNSERRNCKCSKCTEAYNTSRIRRSYEAPSTKRHRKGYYVEHQHPRNLARNRSNSKERNYSKRNVQSPNERPLKANSYKFAYHRPLYQQFRSSEWHKSDRNYNRSPAYESKTHQKRSFRSTQLNDHIEARARNRTICEIAG